MTAVMIGVDPQKGSHTATALDVTSTSWPAGRCGLVAGRWSSCWRGRHRSRRGHGRSSRPTGWAICWPSSFSLPARWWLTCAHVGRQGAGAVVGPVEQERSERRCSVAIVAMHAPMLAAVRVEDDRTVLRLLASITPTWPGGGRRSAVVSTPWWRAVVGGDQQEVVVSDAFALLESTTPKVSPPSNGIVWPASSLTSLFTLTTNSSRPRRTSAPRWRPRGPP